MDMERPLSPLALTHISYNRDSMMEVGHKGDSLGRGPGGKRLSNLVDKLSAGEAASEGDIRSILDDVYDSEATGGWRAQMALESLSLLCGAGAGRRLTEDIVCGDAFLERLTFMLQQDLRLRKKSATATTDMARSALHLVSRLPNESLSKLFSNREATQAFQAYLADHYDEMSRAFAVARLAPACARCWAFLDGRAFANGGFEEGADAQRCQQRVRDWVHDFFLSVIRFCDDASDRVAAAAFSAVGIPLRAHPLCCTTVHQQLRCYWGHEGEWLNDCSADSGLRFNHHKQAFHLQHLGEIVLRSALPRLRRLIHRQSRITTRMHHPPAIDTCASLLVAALRLSTSPSGAPVNSPLLDPATAVDFLDEEPSAASKVNRNGNGRAEVDKERAGDFNSSVAQSPKDLAQEWIGIRLRSMMEGEDDLLAEAAAWATLRVLQAVAIRRLRISTAPRVAEAFLRVLPATRLTLARADSPSLLAGQQEAIAGAAIALRMASLTATAVIMPALLAAAEGIPGPRQRLALLADAVALLLVRPAGGGGRAARIRDDTNRLEAGQNTRGRGRHTAGSGRGGEGRGGSRPLVSKLLDGDWFVALVSDTPRGLRRVVFREEAVAALATACAQVLAAGVVAVSSSTSHKSTITGIGKRGSVRAKPSASAVHGSASHVEAARNGELDCSAVGVAKAERARWSDLESWLEAALSTLEVCARCVTWTSSAGYIAGLAYVRLFSLVLRLLCPAEGDSDLSRVLPQQESSGGARGRVSLDVGREGEGGGMPENLQWARERLASVVDDLMWRLREGLPGRDVRLRLLQATCTHVRLLTIVGGGDRVTEEASMELVSVLQGELGELDAQAGLVTQPQRAPVLTATGDLTGDYNSAGGPSTTRAPGDRRTFGPTLVAVAGSAALDNTASNPVNSGGAVGGRQQPSVRDEAGLRGDDGGVNLSFVGEAGNNLTDVMAHELVVGCLVRLALGAEGETAVEVLQVLGRERERASAREKLGRGAIGPMEEVVAKGIHIVDLLVVGQAGAHQQQGKAGLQPENGRSRPNTISDAAVVGRSLLKRFFGTMDLGWHAAVQPDERVLLDGQARAFDHGAHALPDLHRRLRINLCGGISPFVHGVITVNEDENISNDASSPQPAFDAHAWEEEAPQCQLNGGSDPVVVTATHVVNHGHCLATSGGKFGEDSTEFTASAAARSLFGNVSSSGASSGGGVKDGRVGGVMLRIKAYNATNARLHGFTIRLSFGQGAEPVGMGEGGRVEASVNEVLMPAAAYTLEVPVAPVDGLQDVVVHVSLIFPDAEPEPEFESEGTAELLGVETLGAATGGEGGAALFGGQDADLDARCVLAGGCGGGGSVTVTIHAGSYRLPAEAFLGPPPSASMKGWAGFQTVWSGLPYAHAFPVESCCIVGQDKRLRTAAGVRRAMSVVSKSGGSSRGSGIGGVGTPDARVAAAIRCPGGNTDYNISAGWAFEAWDGTPVLCAVTAMKAPFSYILPSATEAKKGAADGGAGDGRSHEPQQAWRGRMEVRCGSHACALFTQNSAARLAKFVTNGVFAPFADDRERQHQQHQQGDGPTVGMSEAVAGGLNGAHVDWFSRTDVALPTGKGRGGGSQGNIPPSPARGGDREAIGKANVLRLVRILKKEGRVDSTRRTEGRT